MNTKVNLAGVELKNPVMTASGTFGSGEEYSEFVDLSELGAVVTKGVANVPWPGNATPRMCRDLRRNDQRHRPCRTRASTCFCERDIPFLAEIRHEDHRQRLRSRAGRISGGG